MAFGQRVCAQEHHCPSGGHRKGSPDANCVGSHQIDLQRADLVTGDADVTEFSDASGDRVGDFIRCDDLIDDSPGVVHQLARIRSEEHGATFVGDFAYGFQSQIASVNVQCVQEISVDSYFPAAARKTVRYLPGKAATFIFESVTICVVSPSASNVPLSARASS